jgi:hypothetical protein
MSRWRRQQRKRASAARTAAEVTRIIDQALANVRQHLRAQLGMPTIPTEEELRQALEKPLRLGGAEKTTITSEMSDDGRSLKVNVRVENPTPETARVALASGGKWV